ncbi:TlpA family protein disulfide reductase [Herbiconiux sp. L3-i23]|uniref:TlpA family protein disulfide reductase n=1 Tax=Herbiconiux sp. L3-i23 TaxID=2905871 RepID=UPI0020507FF0|nr:thiol-disulfide isomerase [Herbiconiux sp. L3-i23]
MAIVAATALLLAGCASDPLADQYREGSGKDYIAGDGTVETFGVDSRGEPVEFEGATESGDEFSSTDALGDVLVVNFWYAQCPPCRAEARDLQSIAEDSAADGVQFVGVNTRDEAGTALTFAEEFGVTYPSILDYKDAGVQLAFSARIPPNAVPTTLVLDRGGRVAARILGQVTEPSILETIIRETADETA